SIRHDGAGIAVCLSAFPFRWCQSENFHRHHDRCQLSIDQQPVFPPGFVEYLAAVCDCHLAQPAVFAGCDWRTVMGGKTLSMKKRALVLFAHGARDARWAEPFRRLQAIVQSQSPELTVSLAFLELMSPRLPELVPE